MFNNNAYEVIKEILKGTTYDELFAKVNSLVNVPDGWGIAHLFKHLYDVAVEAQDRKGWEETFFAITKGTSFNKVYFSNVFDELIKKLEDDRVDCKENVTYYHIVFKSDAFLEEVVYQPKTKAMKILEIVQAYKTINHEVLSDEENAFVDKQISTLTAFIRWENDYTTEQVYALIKANETAKKCSIAYDVLDAKYREGKISKEELEKEHDKIEEELANVWLNREPDGSRVPIFFDDMEVPTNLKGFYETIFIDF